MDGIKLSFVGFQRILDIAKRSDELTNFEQTTIKYLFRQLDDEYQKDILNKYSNELSFLNQK